MGLLELLQQGKTILSAGSFPGDTPINDPQSGFIQSTSPTNTYSSETIGQPDNGSVLANTLGDTVLDNTNPNSTTATSFPQSSTNYPWFVTGKFGYAPHSFTFPYSAYNNGVYTYLFTNHYNSIIDDDPNGTNPQIQTLSQTSLDNTNPNSTSATVNPLSIDTPYPYFARGKWKANALPFSQIWNANFIYNDNYISNQLDTLSQTSLDNTLPSRAETTDPIPNVDSAPNGYITMGNLPPQVGMGMFGFGPGQYNSNYNWLGGYYSQNNYNNIITTSDNPLVIYTPQSGLSINNNGTAVFSLSNNNYFNQTYLGDTGFPDNVTGNWGNNPNVFQQYYSPSNTYLGNIEQYGGTHPENELSKTSLDNTNNQNESNMVPDSIAYPNHYPSAVKGEFNGAPSQYVSLYNSNNTYLDSVSIQDPNSPQLPTLSNSALDNTGSNAATTIIPNSTAYPNIYPSLVRGEFNSAPLQYTTPYNADNPYLNSVPIQDPNSPQIPTLGDTGLDPINGEHLPTTIIPDNINYPNNYPAIEGVNLGGFGGPNQYDTNWNQEHTYLNNFIQNPEDSTQLAFTGSNLDNSSNGLSTVSHVTPPVNTYKPNHYPILQHVYMGEFNSGPSQYITPYDPNSTYLQKYNTITNPITNPQTNTLSETGLDVENTDALPTSLLFAPTNPDTITLYPVIAGINLGATGSAAQPFTQTYKPSNTYWDNYRTNRSLFDALTA